jgi:PPOX class probable F420-dependent enzyme
MGHAFDGLAGENYINLETFKKDGAGVKTPVWFVQVDGSLFVYTDGTSYKVKRLSRNPKARVAACDMRGKVHGPWLEASAKLVDPGEAEARVYAALGQKYGWQWTVGSFFSRLSGAVKRRRVISIQPA